MVGASRRGPTQGAATTVARPLGKDHRDRRASLSNLLREGPTVPSLPRRSRRARTSRPTPTERAAAGPGGFWAEQAERMDWSQKWERVLDWDDPPFAKWFVGGTLNASYNCVDRARGGRTG